MYRSLCGGEASNDIPEMIRTVSLDEGLSNYKDGSTSSAPVSNRKEEEKYIKKIFGEDLGAILAECASAQSVDPILFLSDLLKKLVFFIKDQIQVKTIFI